MWSKQTDACNANMTSLKSKITSRKRKNSKQTNVQQSVENVSNASLAKKSSKKKHKKGAGLANENKPVECEKPAKASAATLNNNDVSAAKTNCNHATNIDRELSRTDVVLRSELPKSIEWQTNDLNNTLKRYSDSFVIAAENHQKINELSRAQSGFLVTNTEACELIKVDKCERKSRRFSDLFRHGNLKTSSSCDAIKIQPKMIKESICQNDEFSEVTLRKKNEPQKECDSKDVNTKQRKEKKANKTDKQSLSSDNASKAKKSQTKNQKSIDKSNKEEKEQSPANSSYLKRVKSKIYKSKNESVSAQPSMPDINENGKLKKNKKKTEDVFKIPLLNPEIRKSSTYLDFRLIRQTSNLECVRPKSFVPVKSASNAGISELDGQHTHLLQVPVIEKPFLAKSKSSSSINLNLLRARRKKNLFDSLGGKHLKMAEDEFEFIAFGDIPNYPLKEFGSLKSLNNNLHKWINEEGDTKPGHPVTRTGSDRRPDAVREESRTNDGHNNAHENEDDSSHADSSISLPASTGNKRRTSSNINRSESVKEQSEKRKQRRNISDPLHNNAVRDTVDLDQHGFSHTSGSSSNSSLSSRSSESPSTSLDATFHPAGTEDSDLEVGPDPPDWQTLLSEEQLARLHPHEKKIQDVINELFHTERSHVRNLKVLELIFWKRLSNAKILKQEESNLIFSNLSELLDIHITFNASMKQKRKESPVVRNVGDLFLDMFDGHIGETFQKAAAAFCERQQLALEFIKDRRKKDASFEQVLRSCETDKLCRRLPLQGFIPSEMQRLSKYPLLLERLIEYVQKLVEIDPEAETEVKKLKQAYQRSRDILNHVNEAAKEAQHRVRLEEIQRHLDTSMFEKMDHPIVNDFKHLDLTKYKLLCEGGPLSLNRPNKGFVQVHLVILEEIVVMLQREGEKYMLKFFHTASSSLPPIIKMSHMLVRPNAAVKDSIFMINTLHTVNQMYDLRGRDPADTKKWFKHLSEAAEAYNKREGKSKRSEPTPDTEEETVQELPTQREQAERAESVGGSDTVSCGETENNVPSSSDSNQRNSEVLEDDKDKRLSGENEQQHVAQSTSSEVVGGGVTMKLAADDWPLIQPSEMQIVVAPVHKAESVLTPLEQIKRKDEEVRKALADKEVLVADMLSIPREDFHHIADMASEEAPNLEKEPYELVLAAVYQTNKLLEAVNDSLNISEADPVLTKGGKHSSCTSNDSTLKRNKVPSVPVNKFKDIATALNSQLTTLLSVVKQREEDRDRIRKELQKTREQLHEVLSVHGPPPCTDCDDPTHYEGTPTLDLESIEESPTENEN